MGSGQSKKEHLLPPDPFQRNFVPEYNPYGSNYFVYSPRHQRHRGLNTCPLGPYCHRLGPYGSNMQPYGGYGGYGNYRGYGGYGPYGTSWTNPDPLVVNPPCGGQQCTSFLNDSGEYQSSIGTECTCCAMGKDCRMNENAPPGVKYNDCCAGLTCKNNVCMKK